jgi:FkbM family methyltransferase
MNTHKTIVEVGAHTGIETLHFLEDPEAWVFAFEPDHNKYTLLEKKAQEEPRLHMLPFAVDIGDNQSTLWNMPDGNSTLEVPLFSTINPSGFSFVWGMRLDTFMELYSIDTIDYLRLDAPFHEEMCLESLGARIQDVKAGRVRCYDKLIAATWLRENGFNVSMEEPQISDSLPNVKFWRL